MLVKDIDEHTAEETLDAVESIFLAQLEGNAELFQFVAHFADLHNADTVASGGRRDGRVLPGTERSIRLGGPGTPRVAEFALEELGARLRLGSFGIKRMTADALDTRHRLPALWAAMCAGTVKVSTCRYVAQQTRELSAEGARLVDAGVAEFADGRLAWSRFTTLVAAKIIEADPDAAAAREAKAATEQFAKATRSTEHGMKGFYLRATAATVIRIDATVTYIAAALKALGDPDPEDLRRVKAFLILANPPQAVELMAAFAMFRSHQPTPDDPEGSAAPTASAGGHRTVPRDPLPGPGYGDLRDLDDDDDQPFPFDQDQPEPEPETEAEPEAESGACPTCGSTGSTGSAVSGLLVPRRFRPANLPARITSWVTGHHPGPDTMRGSSDPGFVCDWSKLLPTVKLYLHLSQDTLEGDTGGVARWENEPPISAQYVRDHLAPYHRFQITPVIDLAHQVPVDAYEIPHRLAEAVHLRSPAEVFPFSANTSRHLDLDHTDAHVPVQRGGPPGQTRLDNLGPLARTSHRLKTHGRWQVKQPFTGIFIWRDPHGVYYLVDHTGTRKITAPKTTEGTGTTMSRAGPPDTRTTETATADADACAEYGFSSDLTIDLWEADDLLDYQPAHST